MDWTSLMSSIARNTASATKKPSVWSRAGRGLASGVSSQYNPGGFAALGSGGEPPVSLIGGSQGNRFSPPQEEELSPLDLTGGVGGSNPLEMRSRLNKLAPPQDEASMYFDEAQRISGENPATQAYREHIAKMPMREDHKPSGWRRALAALAGGAIAYNDPAMGMNAAMEFRDRPYNEALEGFAGKERVLGAQANIEQDDINARLKALQSARAMGLKYDEFELKKLESASRMENDTVNADAAMIRAEAYAKAQGRPGYDAHAQEDGSVLYVSKTDPTVRHVVPAKTVAAGQLGVAKTNAATSRGQLGVAQQNAATNVRRTNIYGQSVNDTHERGMRAIDQRGTRPPSPDQQQDAEDMAMRQLLSDPLFAEFIEVDDNGFPKVVDDDGSDDYQDFLEELNTRVQSILQGNPARPRRQ